jgi:ABC-2 type transport system ATP-binding protein
VENALEVRGLSKRYGKRWAVKDLDLSVREGDVYGFLGPNGAGKTTAMRCILGLIRRNKGDIRIFGEVDMVRARAQVGAIIETPAFHGWLPGRDNLKEACAYSGIVGKEAAKEMDRVLERVGLKERAKDKASAYSLGMKQRLGIARALLGKPRMMFLDEPTNGLDPRGMAEMRDLIRSLALNDKITVFISSHLLSEVQAICNRVGIIQAGELRAQGTVDELLMATEGEAILEVGASDNDALRSALETMTGIRVVGNGAEGRIRIRHDDIDSAEVNALLTAAGVRVSALVPMRRDLEDVFLEVTG